MIKETLQSYKNIARSHWQALAKRERKIVAVGAILLLLILGYALVLEPFLHSITKTKHIVAEKRALVAWMQHAVPRLKALQKSGLAHQSIGDESLLSFIDSSARSNRLHRFITQLEQSTNQKQVTLNLNQVPFDDLIAWLTELWKTYNITVQSINIKRLPKSGMVKANLSIQ